MTHRVKLVVSASHFSEVASGARNVSHTPKHRIGIRLYMTLVVGLCAAMGYVLTPVVVNPSGVHSPVRPSTPRATVHAKVVGAALAAAFASKNGKSDSKVEDDLSLEAKQRAVVESIQTVLAAASSWKPRETFSALGEFGQASGGLATSWLTPEQLEDCYHFWEGGSTLMARDLRRGKVAISDLKASLWFGLLTLNTFPWTPLFIPLVGRAVNNGTSDDSRAFVPVSFRSSRLAALRRLRNDSGLSAELLASSPQNIDQGVAFFSDGTRMALRDLRRGRALLNGDSPATYGWFALLALSTFPLTPLLLPLIDKRRADGTRSDYVPESFRPHRLAAFERLRSLQKSKATSADAIATLRAAAAASASDAVAAAASDTTDGATDETSLMRPAPGELLAAIAVLGGSPHGREHFLDRLAGGGTPGRRWQLLYVAGKDALISARQLQKEKRRVGEEAGAGPNSLQYEKPAPPTAFEGLGATLVPWKRLKDGLYVDRLVCAVQRFDATCDENENGFFGDWGRFTVNGPFKWPAPELGRTICAFQPTHAKLNLGAMAWEFPMPPVPVEVSAGGSDGGGGMSGSVQPLPFEEVPVTKLPFFKFLWVDDTVAVAQGRSGSVAMWRRID